MSPPPPHRKSLLSCRIQIVFAARTTVEDVMADSQSPTLPGRSPRAASRNRTPRARDGVPVYRALWGKVGRNILAGTLISLTPGFIFFSAAFSYTPAQTATMMRIAVMVVSVTLAMDLGLTRLYLVPAREM